MDKIELMGFVDDGKIILEIQDDGSLMVETSPGTYEQASEPFEFRHRIFLDETAQARMMHFLIQKSKINCPDGRKS